MAQLLLLLARYSTNPSHATTQCFLMADVNLNPKPLSPTSTEATNWPDKKPLSLNLNTMLSKILFILADNKHNFNKYGHGSIDSLGVPYDYGSIMHYGKREFARWPWQTTIRPRQSGASIGQRSHLSPLDVKQMNLYYNCHSKK